MAKGKVNSIHYLRGIAALMVVFYHLRLNLNDVYAQANLGDILFGSGAFGVDLFFIISGFIICYATEKKESNSQIKYIIRRFFRIYPLLVLSLLITFFFVSDGTSLYFLVRSLIPLNANYSADSPFFGYNLLGPAWTLTYEIAFYAIFLISFTISHKYRWLVSIAIICMLVLGIQQWQNGYITLNAYNNNSFSTGNLWHAPLTFLASPLFLDFIYGIVIYKIHSVIKNIRVTYPVATWINIFSAFVFFVSALGIISVQVYGHGPLQWGGWCAVLILSGLVYENFGTIPESKSLNLLGNVSYSLYMTHAIIIEVFHNYSDVFSLFNNQKGMSQIVYIVTVSLLVAYITHRFIELPFISIGRKFNSIITHK